jgi:TolA-binding protein
MAAHPRNPDISAERTTPEQHAASVEEARAFEVARAAITRGDNTGALTALNAYDVAFPNGALKPDAMALRVQALQRSGKTAEAQALTDELKRKYPTRLLAPQ